MDEKTVKQHMEACRAVEALIDDSNALVTRLHRGLCQVRETLEALREYQHPKVQMEIPYSLRQSDSNQRVVSPVDLINMQVKHINSLLGDRA